MAGFGEVSAVVGHRVFLRAYGDNTNPGAGMMALECSCGAQLWDQGEDPGAVYLDDLVRLAGGHVEG